MDGKMLRYKAVVAILSLLLMIMVIPHTLEDFALGEPAKNGIPILILQVVVALLVAVQALGLYLLGGNHRLGYFIQMGIGIIWPLLAGSAQLPAIFSSQPYRSGFSSVFFVIGMILIGALLFLASIQGLRITAKEKN
ncbi:MAG: hypothetical protein GX046_08555 [Tissierellia bacterium]|nr:hypothetical protein [Tissierellia bacterium]